MVKSVHNISVHNILIQVNGLVAPNRLDSEGLVNVSLGENYWLHMDTVLLCTPALLVIAQRSNRYCELRAT